MGNPKFLPFAISFDNLRRYSLDGRIYRAYDHLIAAVPGMVLMVPPIVVQGRFDGVIDGCPIPWEEVCALLDQESLPFMMSLVDMKTVNAELDRLDGLGLDRTLWEFDFIGIHDNTRRNVLRFAHQSGVRYAVAFKSNEGD